MKAFRNITLSLAMLLFSLATFANEITPIKSLRIQSVAANKFVLFANTNLEKVSVKIKDLEGLLAEDQNNKGNAHLIENFDQLDLTKHRTNFGEKSLLKEVNVTTLDKYFSEENNLEKLDFIKIDVEGLEWKVIKGGKELIKKFRPIIVAETHRGVSDMFGYDCITPIFEFLYSLNYESYSLDDYGNLKKFLYPNFKMDTIFISNKKNI